MTRRLYLLQGGLPAFQSGVPGVCSLSILHMLPALGVNIKIYGDECSTSSRDPVPRIPPRLHPRTVSKDLYLALLGSSDGGQVFRRTGFVALCHAPGSFVYHP